MTLNTRRQAVPKWYHYFDAAGMPVIKGDIKSYLDSLGRLILMWIAYGFPTELENTIETCLQYGKKYYELHRHPWTWDKTSRDHWSYFVIYRYFLTIKKDQEGKPISDEPFFYSFLSEIPRMRGITPWIRTLTGSRKAQRRYFRWQIPGARLGNAVYKILYFLGDFEQAPTLEEWTAPAPWNKDITLGHYIQINRTPWQRFIVNTALAIIPAYPLHNKAWQLFVMPESAKKEKLKRILLKRVDQDNHLVRVLLGDKGVSIHQVIFYPHVTGYRPGVNLMLTKRDIRLMRPKERAANAYEKDLLITTFYFLNPKQKEENNG
jgi:hypothetical protein